MKVPEIRNSTKDERKEYIRETYRCKSDCDNCGICMVLKGKIPELAFSDYINGLTELKDIKLY